MKEIGIYLHVPFCIKKCYYCDFCSVEVDNTLVEEYVSSLIKEIEKWKEQMESYHVKSIFIGGGTPSLLGLKDMDRILGALYKSFKLKKDFEFSIESNPGTLNKEKLRYYLSSGINRLSIGLQAWQDHLLKKLGRIHNSKEFRDNYLTARNVGFENINIDLMFGLPDQTLDDWYETLVKTVALSPEHISAYSLKIEETTPFSRLYDEGKLNLPKEDIDRSMYHNVVNFLSDNGYLQYEISNFALMGKECIHNNIYWNNDEYLGFGVGAHSYLDKKRFSNEENLNRYINDINNKEDAIVFKHENSLKEEIEETMFLGLRRSKGISIDEFNAKYGRTPMDIYSSKLNHLEKQGLIILSDKRIRLTLKGYDLSNQVFTELLLD